jgi:hypothetical protein
MMRDIPKLLALAEERVRRTDVFLHRQHEIIERLLTLGQDTTAATAVLRQLGQMQSRFLANRNRLRQELEQERPDDSSIAPGDLLEAVP